MREAISYQNDNRIQLDLMPHIDPLPPFQRSGYGYQFWMLDYPGAYLANGSQGQYAMAFPDKDIVIAMTQIINGQKTQTEFDAIYKFVNSVQELPLPENPVAADKLRSRMSRLSIEAPAYQPYSARSAAYSGRFYYVNEGRFTFYPVFQLRECMGTHREVTHGVDYLTFDFSSPRFTKINFSEDGVQRKLYVAMDGTRAVNWHPNPHHIYSEVHYSGYWEDDYSLVVDGRWVEGTVVKRFCFTFHDKGIHIHAFQAIGAMGGMARDGETAEAVAKCWIVP